MTDERSGGHSRIEAGAPQFMYKDAFSRTESEFILGKGGSIH
jgi:hypothetical protein